MGNTTIYRKRLIPNELILLKNDEILFLSEDVLVTKWNVLKPRKDFVRGYSCYFLNKGYKISKFIDENNQLLYYYCDIIDTDYNKETDTYIFTDLLVDVIIYPDGFVKVVDIDEISQALDENLITLDMTKRALIQLNSLLNIIYSGNLNGLTDIYLAEH